MHRNITNELARWWPRTPLGRDIVASVYQAGEIARNANRTATTKADEGHRSVETEGDHKAQDSILSSMQQYPNLRFLCEEDSNNPRVLPKKDPVGIFSGIVALADLIDGTSLYADGYPDWCSAGGLMEDGVFTASAVYAPQTNDGMLVASYQDGPLLLSEDGAPFQEVAKQIPRAAKKSIILYGVDASMYKAASDFMLAVAPNVRATRSCGSGLFGLTCVALGRAAAIFQPPQKPWDWSPLYHAVTSNGNIFLFFRIINGELSPVERFDYAAFTFDKESKAGRLGFIAGEPTIAHKLFDRLPRSGWVREKPDPTFIG